MNAVCFTLLRPHVHLAQKPIVTRTAASREGKTPPSLPVQRFVFLILAVHMCVSAKWFGPKAIQPSHRRLANLPQLWSDVLLESCVGSRCRVSGAAKAGSIEDVFWST